MAGRYTIPKMVVNIMNGKKVNMKQILTILLVALATTAFGQPKKFSTITPGPVSSGVRFLAVKDSAGSDYDRLLNIADVYTYLGGAATLQQVITNGDTSSNPAYFTGAGKKRIRIDGATGGGNIVLGLVDSLTTHAFRHKMLYLDSLGIKWLTVGPGATQTVTGLFAKTPFAARVDTLQGSGGLLAYISDITAAAALLDLEAVLTNGNTADNSIVLSNGTISTEIGENLIILGNGVTGSLIMAHDSISFYQAGVGIGLFGKFNPPTLTDHRTWRMPDSSGTVALTRNVTGAVDTNIIATRAWRQKGDDSIAALIETHAAGTPTVTAGPGAGVGTVASLLYGDDRSGVIGIATGGSGTTGTNDIICTLTFASAYSGAPMNVIIIPFQVAAGTAPLAPYPYAAGWSTTKFDLKEGFGGALASSVTYLFQYIVIQQL